MISWIEANWKYVAITIVTGVIAADQAFGFIPPASMHVILAVVTCLGLYRPGAAAAGGNVNSAWKA